MTFAVCLSFTDQRPEVDALTGEVATDERSSGLSAADAAALELALQVAAAWGGTDVVAVTVGPPAADAVLRDALAVGATQAVRVDLAAPRSAEQVAAALRSVVGGAAVSLVWCGDQGLDAGSGAVPAFLAAQLGVGSALGLVDVVAGASPADGLTVLRRLDGGRRERLAVTGPAVLSVEGGVARLRRAGLPAVVRAGKATIDVVPPPAAGAGPVSVRHGLPMPYRPAPRVVAPPSGDRALDRVRALTGAGGGSGTSRSGAPRVASPDEAADAILASLATWGYELPERAER